MKTKYAVLFVFCLALPVLSAAPDGSIKGYVKDKTGGVVPNAVVTLTSEGTNVSQSTSADATGYFQFLLNKLGGTKRILPRHPYGATVGGLVRKDHTFFFYSRSASGLQV